MTLIRSSALLMVSSSLTCIVAPFLRFTVTMSHAVCTNCSSFIPSTRVTRRYLTQPRVFHWLFLPRMAGSV